MRFVDFVVIADRTRLPSRIGVRRGPVRRDFRVARGLRHEIGIGEEREVQVVERRRLEARAVARGEPPLGRDLVSPRDAAGRLAAVLARVVVAQVGLQRKSVVTQLVHARHRVRVPLRHGEVAVRGEMLLAPLQREGQRAEGQRPVVLPCVLSLRRLERGLAERRERDRVVAAFADCQDRVPLLAQAIAAHHRPGLERGRGAVVEVRRAGVERIVEPVAEILHRHVLPGGPREQGVAAHVLVGVAVAVGVVAEVVGIDDRVEARRYACRRR